MAQELRHEHLYDTVADGTTSADAGAEFRNDSAGMVHIRAIVISGTLSTAAPNESASIEVSKAPVYQGATANSPFYSRRVHALGPPTGATPADGGVNATFIDKYGRGQLTLEPNESLFLNTSKSSGGTVAAYVDIDYEFG